MCPDSTFEKNTLACLVFLYFSHDRYQAAGALQMEMKWLPDATGAGVDKEVWSQWAGPHPSAEVGGAHQRVLFFT